MEKLSLAIGDHAVIAVPHLQALLAALHRRGYQVVGPTVRDGAIVYDELDSTTDLPIGWTDEQDGGIYRLKKRHLIRRFLAMLSAHIRGKSICCRRPSGSGKRSAEGSVQIVPEQETPLKLAFIGVRSCEPHRRAG